MKTVRFSRSVLTVLVIFISACAFPPSAPTIANTPVVSATEPEKTPAHSPDVVFHNGIILTMDENQPRARAIAIDGGSILAVGSDSEILALRGSSTVVVDLQGKAVTPGFIDSHQHRIGDRSKRGYTDADPIIQIAIEQGWTTLDELYVNQERLNELRALDQEGRLRLRVNAFLPVMDNSPEGTFMVPYYEGYTQGQMVSPRVRVAGLKVFTDFDNATILFWEQGDLNAYLLKLHQEGWQLAVKTVSSRSLEMILRAFEYIESSDPSVLASRGRLEHVLFLTPGQIARVKHLGLIPSIQSNMPGEMVGDQGITELIGREPSDSAFPWRSLVDSGIIFANGSAWPSNYVDEPTGAPFGSPIRLIYQAVTRAGNLGAQPEAWMLDQTITAEEALRGLTIDAAYANFQDGILGSLTPGKLADLVILSDNPLSVSTSDINNSTVLMTMIDGHVEYCAVGFASLCPGLRTPGPMPSQVSEGPESTSFTGAWEGADPPDGSILTLFLVQKENGLTGTYSDTYSPNVDPPGYEGTGSGTTLSSTTAQMTFSLTRWDGKSAQAQYSLTLSNQNQTLTLGCEAGCPIVLQRQ